ncbi:guanine nucleotide-binding protein [Aureococcus anophagefferens]|nr:guanine nucleotide-binding protein [Aureococcus anophagefferens]
MLLATIRAFRAPPSPFAPHDGPLRRQGKAKGKNRKVKEETPEHERSVAGAINWYPGHIARRARAARLPESVGVVIGSGAHRRGDARPDVSEWIGARPRVVVFTFADLAPANVVRDWKEELSRDVPVFFVDAKRGGAKALQGIRNELTKAGRVVNEKRAKKGIMPRAARVAVIGYPSVGKSGSSTARGRKAAKSENKAGVTRSLNWVRSKPSTQGKGLPFELLDSPGIIPAKQLNQRMAARLAICGDIGDASYDTRLVAEALVEELTTRRDERYARDGGASLLSQYSGAAIILYAYSETDVMMLRLWTVSGLLCYSLVPNVVRGNVLLSAWACLFVGINAVRLVELASERAPVQLDDDEWACYERSGLARFVPPQCFKRLAASGEWRDLEPDAVIKRENEKSPNFFVVRSGSVLLSAPRRPVGGVLEAGALFRRAIEREKDPRLEGALVKFVNEQLMKKMHLRDHGHSLERYDALLGAALRGVDARVSPDDKAALQAFRAAHGLTEGDHAACLHAHGWTPEDFEIGARFGVEGTAGAQALSVATDRRASVDPARKKAGGGAVAKAVVKAAGERAPAPAPPPPPRPAAPPKPKKKPALLQRLRGAFPSFRGTTHPDPRPRGGDTLSESLRPDPSKLRASYQETASARTRSAGGLSLEEIARHIAARRRNEAPPPPPQATPRSGKTGEHRAKLLSVFDPPPEAARRAVAAAVRPSAAAAALVRARSDAAALTHPGKSAAAERRPGLRRTRSA